MSNGRRSRYPYPSYSPPPGSSQSKPGLNRPLLWFLVPALGLVGVAFLLLVSGIVPAATLSRYLPFPKKLQSVEMLHNGQKISLKDNDRLVLNPRDTLQLLEVTTDSWIRWGTHAEVKDFPVRSIEGKPATVGKLWPNESFETPKEFELQVLWRDLVLGQVSAVVQLDARDWLQKGLAIADPEQRIGYLQKALAENPANVLIKTQLAATYLEQKKYAQAAQLYEEIVEKGKSREVLESLLHAYQQQGKVEQALTVYVELLKLNPDADIFKQFVQYTHRQRDKHSVADFIARQQRNFPKEFQANLALMLAEIYTQSKDWGKAAAAYEDAIRRGVHDQNVYYNLAVAYQQNRDLGRASRAMGVYLQKNPKDLKSRLELAQMQEKQGSLDQARATYEAILKDDPNQEKVLLQLIAILEKSRDKAALRTAYQRLVKMEPKNKVAQFNLGVLYYEAKSWPEATTAFEAVASIDPKDLESRKHLLDLYRKQNNTKGEVRILTQLAQLQPNQNAHIESLFAVYDKKQDYRAMVDLFQELVKTRRDSVVVHQYLLYGLLKMGNKKAAVAELEQLVRLQPNEKKHLRQAANLYQELGKYPEAAKKVDQLLKLDPKNKELQDEYLRLRRRTLATPKKG